MEILTASCSPFIAEPQYTAAKHALVGLTRASAPSLKAEGILINAICPGFVLTPLTPQWMHEYWPRRNLTPMNAVVDCFDVFLEDDTKSGEVLELSGGGQFFRKPVEYSNEAMRWAHEDSGALWKKYGSGAKSHL